MRQATTTPETQITLPAGRATIRFDRNELAGAFGDMGTDVPLLIGMALAAGLDGTSTLVMFGVMQLLTGLIYRLPMPVQPLKAMAAIVIARQASAATLYGAGLAIGLVMLVLAATGLLDWLARVVPKCVVRGIQLGLGLQLASVALGKFVQADGVSGYALAAFAFIVTILLLGNRRFPAALPVVLLGLVYAMIFKWDGSLARSFGFHLPGLRVPQPADILTGFLVLALPQIPLSLGNSVLATWQLARDLFPDRRLTIRKIGLTYALMNLANPWFGGVPTCHGSGGMAGHFAFGGRTGGSVIIYGLLFVLLGLFFGTGFDHVATAFPLPILGVILLFEALALIWLLRDTAPSRSEFPVALLVGLLAFGLPYGYVIGLVVGTVLFYLGGRTRLVSPDAV
ncbi:MAG: putative sulfate/molybdate transporter [Armatimonadota bacterium]|nr:putative sulfate/molybdate transporter [Armatimonadota bacterium]MDR7533289.1 putative sulfate/molybdate transporter [Armatimonadota bacterium]MDR7536592.1 putative sulfate/molybdate transporter [Armatimonadota bacterium]